MRDLIVILGDQLDASAAVLEHADPDLDAIWMCECRHESTKVWSHKARTAMFLAAMRHFAETLRERGFTVHYRALDHHAHTTLDAALAAELKALSPKRVRLTATGEARALYRSPPEGNGEGDAAPEGADPPPVAADEETSRAEWRRWPISYILADLITSHLVEGEVRFLEAEGNVRGLQLEPGNGGSE